MSKAIQAALVIPSSDYIYSVGGQPVLTGWGHKKTGETSAPEILKLITANNIKPNTQSTTNNQDPNQLNQVNSTNNREIVYSSVLVSSYPYRIIQWFLWLIFFGILFLLFWLYLKHCSLNLPFQDKILLNYCQSNINKAYDPELNILQNKLNQLEQKIAEKKGYCVAEKKIEEIQSLIPTEELQEEENLEEPLPITENEELNENIEVVEEELNDNDDGIGIGDDGIGIGDDGIGIGDDGIGIGDDGIGIGDDGIGINDKDDSIDRVIDEGGEISSLNIILTWNNLDDLDLHLECPSGKIINYKQQNKQNCGGRLDIDMNQNRIHMSETPVENIFFEEGKAELGEYKIYVNRYTDRLPLNNETPYKIQLIKDGQLIKQKKGSVVNINEQKYIFSFKIPLE